MSAHLSRVAASPRPILAYESDVEASTSQRVRAPHIHPALYAFALVSACILLGLSVAALGGYNPPRHALKHDDELFLSRRSADQPVGDRSQLDRGAPQKGQVSTFWNGIANVLGGFSTAYVTSPQLNTSWVARPAGFGGRIARVQGLTGKLDYMSKSAHPVSVSRDAAKVDLTGCQLAQPIHSPPRKEFDLPRIALIQRGECQFLTKLLNAQAQGFDAAVVFNDHDHSRRQRWGRDGDGTGSDEGELISMWSPSRESALLRIPSVFVAYRTGKILATLLAIEGENAENAMIILEPEDAPHFFLMDIIIALFFLPTIFTTIVLVSTRLRQIRHRAQQRAPQTLVDSLPTFEWREGLELDLDALASEEKSSDHSAPATTLNGPDKSAGMDHRLAALLSKALRRPAPAGNGISARHAVIPARKARLVAKKIFRQKECAICLSDFVTGETVRLLPCGHLYHKDEIDSWLLRQKRWCPVCRFRVDGEDEESMSEQSLIGEENRSRSVPLYGSPAAARPIIMPEDIVGDDLDTEQPVASSSTLSERTPLLQTLSTSDKA